MSLSSGLTGLTSTPSTSSLLGSSTGGTSSSGSGLTSSTSNPNGAPISFSGIASGLNTTSIIQKLLQLAQEPITQDQTQQSTLQSKEQLYNQLSTNLTAISTAATTLTAAGAFDAVQAQSSNTSVATITAGTGATDGTYNLSVSQLAQAQKIASSAFSSTTTALGLSGGTFIVNGQAVSVNSTDSLQSIAGKINSLNSGVTASLINGGTGSAYITLTSQASGAANQIQLADLSGTTLNTLGLIGGTAVANSPSTTASSSSSSSSSTPPTSAVSYAFSSQTSTIASMLGTGSGTTDSFTINGGSSINVDLSTDTLQSVADKINAAGAGVTASIVTNNSGSTPTYQLSLSSSSGMTFSDPNNLLQGLGVLQQAPVNQLLKGQDAKYTLDSISLTSASNTITSAIPGATLTLLQGSTTASGSTTATPSTAALTLTQDTSSITSNIQAFTSAYNGVVDFISENASYNTTTNTGGPLFGDATTEQVQSQLTNMIFTSVPGLKGSYDNLASLGFTFSSSGDLNVDSSTLTQALTTDPSAVAAIFQASGSASTPDLAYVSSTSASKASGSGSYAVNITQSATQQTYTAGTQFSQPSTQSEDLTFKGNMFTGGSYTIDVPTGATLSSLVDQINSDSTLGSDVVASNQNGYLSLQSKLYGKAGNFTVSSSDAASSSNSGVGNSGGGTTIAGQDVAGTINGETATGNGQYLTGNSGNANTDGLQIQYTGTSTGNVGTVSFSNGIGVQLTNLVTSFTTPSTGIIADANASLQKQYNDLQTQINNLNTQVAAQQTNLQTEFNNMESAMAASQQQASQLTAMFSSSTGGSIS